MGLDATGYSNAKLLEVGDYDLLDEKYADRDVVLAFVNPDFKSWRNQIKNKGIYEYGESAHVGIGYSSHHTFRDILARIACGLENANDIWANPAKYEKSPFYYLINFSDCEGVIGSKYSAKLAKDFAEYQHAADNVNIEWFRRYYADWRKVFETAADNGFVDFH